MADFIFLRYSNLFLLNVKDLVNFFRCTLRNFIVT